MEGRLWLTAAVCRERFFLAGVERHCFLSGFGVAERQRFHVIFFFSAGGSA
jgi:hypothetical protein